MRYTLFGTEEPFVNYIIKDNDLENLKEEAKKRLLKNQTAFIMDNETLIIIDFKKM